MTELIYQTDSYCREFDATVVALDEPNHAVLLERTAFYPGGGGQPYDLGLLRWDGGEVPLERVYKRTLGNLGHDDVWHMLAAGEPLPPTGALVHGVINWDRRYRLMRTHSALHILCGVVFRDYRALVTGGDMEPLQGRMDFEFETMTRDLVSVIEAAINREVQAARPIKVRILSRLDAFAIPDLIRTKINLLPPDISEIRTVEIVGLDLQADGGTHVANTAEVGPLHVVDYKSKGKINKRLYLEVAPRE
jgi:misacylated tRNA(Ala) deacylase